MLDQLIQFTNSREYIQNCGLYITEVIIKPGEDSEMKITLEILDRFEPEPNDGKQIWEINCIGIIYSTSNKIHEPKTPYDRINLYRDHPILWNYDDKQWFKTKGTCTNISALIGDLFMAHDKACGDWVDFHWLFHYLPKALAAQKEQNFHVPQKLIEVYVNIFRQYGLDCLLTEKQQGQTDLSVLIFGNSDISPDDYCFGQPHVVAEKFQATRLK
jgi:hypothetical protein